MMQTVAVPVWFHAPIPDPGREIAIRDIVFPSDLSSRSDRAFDHCRLLAEATGATVRLFHAVEDTGDHDPLEVREERWRRAEAAARAHLERRAAGLGAPYEIVVEQAKSARTTVVDYLRRAHPDLAVMATHTRHGLTQLVPGSVTEAALGAAGVPVLCVREPDHGVGLPYRRVLVPTDMSEASRRAFRMAALLADQFGAEVVALHVAPVAAAHSLAGLPELMETRVPSEEDVWRFLLPELLGLRVAPRVRLGSAWGWITRLAHEDKADVIVMSTHGHDSLGDRVLGSHTERVLRSAPCPVLVV